MSFYYTYKNAVQKYNKFIIYASFSTLFITSEEFRVMSEEV